MLEIKIENSMLDLGKVNISFELISPVFNTMGSFSYPFTLPATDKNKSILGFSNRINTTTSKSSCNAEIFLSGLLWKRGLLRIIDANKDFIKCNFEIGNGHFYSVLKNIKLFDLELGGTKSYANDYYEWNVSSPYFGPWGKVWPFRYPDIPFAVFPFNMPNFYEDSAKGTFLRNNFDGNVNYFTFPDHLFSHSFNTFVVFPYLNFVFDKIWLKANVNEVSNAFRNDPFLKYLTLFNSNTEYAWHPDDLIDGFRLDRINLRDYMPDLGILDLITTLEDVFQAYIFYDEFTNSVKIALFKDIVNSPDVEILDFPFKITSLSPNQFDGYSVEYDIDSNDSFADDYFKSIDQFTFKGEIPDESSLPANGNSFLDMYFVTSTHKYMYWMINSVNPNLGSWQTYASDRNKFTSGNGGLTIKIPGVFARETYLPKAGNVGHWQVVDQDYSPAESPELRFIFYHGVVNNKPFGSPFNLDESGNVISDYSLEWEGDFGLKNKFYKEYLSFKQNTRQGEFKMLLDPAAIKSIDFSKKYRFANANWLLSKIKITISNEKISPAEITAFKV